MKKQNAITLVSMVVTIVILIILAGISLNLTLGENGLFQMSLKAKENMELAQIEDQEKLNALYTQLAIGSGNIGGAGSGGTSYDAIQKLLEFKQEIANAIKKAGGNAIEEATTAETKEYEEAITGIVEKVTSDADATAEDIAEGKWAYVNGKKIQGTMKNMGKMNAENLVEIKTQVDNSGGDLNEKYTTISYTITEKDVQNYKGYILFLALTGGTDVSFFDVSTYTNFTPLKDGYKTYSHGGKTVCNYSFIYFAPPSEVDDVLSITFRGCYCYFLYGIQ